MRYNVTTGVEKTTLSVKKYVIGGTAVVLMVGAMAAPAFAALPQPPVSDNANGRACFGQERAAYAQGGPNGVLSPNSNGTYISERKGTNPANNADFIATYCN